MRPAASTLAVLVVLTITGSLAPLWSVEASPRPLRLVAFGDSFTEVSSPGRIRPEWSWATGDDVPGGSVAERLRAVRGAVEAHNGARSGWRMAALPQEVAQAPRDADLVLVLLGLNDLCWVPPTSVPAFLEATREGFEAVAARHPRATVVVFAPPDVTRLHELHLQRPEALALWANVDFCRDAFAPSADGATLRQASLRQSAFNAVLKAEARAHGFAYSAATYRPGFTLHDLQGDFFHPALSGQARLAAAAWPSVQDALSPGAVPVRFNLS